MDEDEDGEEEKKNEDGEHSWIVPSEKEGLATRDERLVASRYNACNEALSSLANSLVAAVLGTVGAPTHQSVHHRCHGVGRQDERNRSDPSRRRIEIQKSQSR